MKKVLISIIFIFSCVIFSYGQTIECPKDKVCISQEAAQKAAENARLIPQLQNKIDIQSQSLDEKDKSIKELKDTGAKNESDLKDRLQKTEIDLATKTGQLISDEAEKQRLLAIIDFMLKNGRIKKYGLINIF